jgi:mono/diheme cytochrome c family protein
VPRSRLGTAAALLAVTLAAAALAGCGGSNTSSEPPSVEPTEPVPADADPTAGAEVWESAGCGTCHTLAAAGATGTVGPNLDESPVDYGLVANRVEIGGGAMPAFGGTLSDEQIRDVAAYVVQAQGG